MGGEFAFNVSQSTWLCRPENHQSIASTAHLTKWSSPRFNTYPPRSVHPDHPSPQPPSLILRREIEKQEARDQTRLRLHLQPLTLVSRSSFCLPPHVPLHSPLTNKTLKSPPIVSTPRQGVRIGMPSRTGDHAKPADRSQNFMARHACKLSRRLKDRQTDRLTGRQQRIEKML